MLKKIIEKLKIIIGRIKRNFNNYDFNLFSFGLKVILTLLIFYLSYNIYLSVNRGLQNLDNIQKEEQKLAILIAENENLQETLKYYSSNEFRRSYARESWNYGQEGEELYYIKRYNQPDIEYLENDSEPILLNDNSHWWERLILVPN